jgi:hypothetical protein
MKTYTCEKCGSSQTEIRERDQQRICTHCGAEIEEPEAVGGESVIAIGDGAVAVGAGAVVIKGNVPSGTTIVAGAGASKYGFHGKTEVQVIEHGDGHQTMTVRRGPRRGRK